MTNNEEARGRRTDTDSIIARMEAQFKESRRPAVDTVEEAHHFWFGPGHDALHFYTPLGSGSEAVGATEPLRDWRVLPLASTLGSAAEGVHPLLLRWFLTRSRERSGEIDETAVLATLQSYTQKQLETVPVNRQVRFQYDLEYVLKRLKLVFAGDQGLIWLESHNYNLNARPIDVLRERGPAEVLVALDAEEQGAL